MKGRIGLIDVDGHRFPNFALMRLSAYHKLHGDNVEWAVPAKTYDVVAASKIFTFSPDFDYSGIDTHKIIKGGTGYDIGSDCQKRLRNRLPWIIHYIRSISFLSSFSHGDV